MAPGDDDGRCRGKNGVWKIPTTQQHDFDILTERERDPRRKGVGVRARRSGRASVARWIYIDPRPPLGRSGRGRGRIRGADHIGRIILYPFQGPP